MPLRSALRPASHPFVAAQPTAPLPAILRPAAVLLALAAAGCAARSRQETYDAGALWGERVGRTEALIACGNPHHHNYAEVLSGRDRSLQESRGNENTFQQAYAEWLPQGRMQADIDNCRPPNTVTEAERRRSSEIFLRLVAISDREYLRNKARREAEDPVVQARAAAARQADTDARWQQSQADSREREAADKQRELEKRIRRLEEEKRRHQAEEQLRRSQQQAKPHP